MLAQAKLAVAATTTIALTATFSLMKEYSSRLRGNHSCICTSFVNVHVFSAVVHSLNTVGFTTRHLDVLIGATEDHF
ncbi:hypothetical protein PF002_g23493 [Phytophthora fragariae]|uniref:Uncharacterized protein n=1 Tax=Phytophthora fragariae TaxID=53985 RepID=A0A6A3X9G4_9STRA|nr:hypothetical protein PF002_g23493 [Phytophthora fragariae]